MAVSANIAALFYLRWDRHCAVSGIYVTKYSTKLNEHPRQSDFEPNDWTLGGGAVSAVNHTIKKIKLIIANPTMPAAVIGLTAT